MENWWKRLHNSNPHQEMRWYLRPHQKYIKTPKVPLKFFRKLAGKLQHASLALPSKWSLAIWHGNKRQTQIGSHRWELASKCPWLVLFSTMSSTQPNTHLPTNHETPYLHKIHQHMQAGHQRGMVQLNKHLGTIFMAGWMAARNQGCAPNARKPKGYHNHQQSCTILSATRVPCP